MAKINKFLPERFLKKVNVVGECWIWTAFKNNWGYGKYSVNRKPISAHRFCWEHLNGEIPDGLCVLHKCDTPECVNPLHLFLGTNGENVKDKVAKGRQSRMDGEKNGSSKLTQDEVLKIRMLYKKGTKGVTSEFSYSGLAKKFGVSNVQISRIISKKCW